MYLHTLALENVRTIANRKVTFEIPVVTEPLSGVTVLTGANGAGKTSFLQAIVHGILGSRATDGGELRLLRTGAERGKIAAVLTDGTAQARRTVELELRGEGRSRSELHGYDGRPWSASYHHPPKPLAFVAAYSAMRLDSPQAQELLTSAERERGHRSMDPRATAAVRSLMHETSPRWMPTSQLPGADVSWIDEDEREVLTARRGEIGGLLSQIVFDGRVMIESSGVAEMRLERMNGDTFPLREAPGGYRDLLRWLSDLLTRLALHLDQDTSPLASAPGIVLVDEIELHLHPLWQKQLIHRLSSCLPRLQFVVTTHSPVLLSGLHSNNIRVFVQGADGLAEVYDLPNASLPVSIDEILLGPWFNLHNVRSPSQLLRLQGLAAKAESGSQQAAEGFVEELLRGRE